MVSPTRFPSGVGNRRSIDPMGNLPIPDPTSVFGMGDDFVVFTSGQWTNTTTGTGTAALTAGDGGILALATSGTSADNVFLQKTTESISLEVGRQTWFKTRFKISALTSVIVVGLQVTDTTPLDVTDGVYFLSTTGTGALTIYSRRNATTGSTSGAAGTLVADTYTELAWYWDGKDSIAYWQDGQQKGTLTGVAAAFLPDTTLTLSFGVQTSSAAVKTLSVDYLVAIKRR